MLGYITKYKSSAPRKADYHRNINSSRYNMKTLNINILSWLNSDFTVYIFVEWEKVAKE